MTTTIERGTDGTLADILRNTAPVTLGDVVARAELQTRVDSKFVIDIEAFRRWTALLSDELAVLTLDSRSAFAYESRYFDTPDHALFRWHRQGRRRRYKVRTRTYLDSHECQFEVKLQGNRGETVKQRIAHPFTHRDRLTLTAYTQLATVLGNAALPVPTTLVPSLTNTYRRSTLLLRDEPVRITCDVGIRWTHGRRVAVAAPHLVIVEVKSATARNLATRTFSRLGIRPATFTKYCVGLALVEPELHANPWRASMRLLDQAG